MELYYPLIVDGATGTELQKRGYDGSICAEQWVLEHPEAIIDLQQKYVAAGSRIVYAPTFSANSLKLGENGITGQTAEFNKKLVAISKQAVAGKAFVAGDISATGKFLRPLGDVDFETLVEIYTEQAAALEEAGVDLFVIETQMSVSDARAAVLAVRSVSDKPIFVTFSATESGKTISGSDLDAVALIMEGMGVDAFGLNCSAGPDGMLELIRQLRSVSRLPLIAKPNAGLPEVKDGKTVYDCPPDLFTSFTDQLLAAGVCIFGGCCGTTPEHIAALSEKLAGKNALLPAPDSDKAALLPAATEKKAFFLPRDIRCNKVLDCTPALEEALEDLDDSVELLAIRIQAESDLACFAELQYLITRPLCLHCSDVSLLEKALRLYQGRALYEGPLSKADLQPLVKKYGLIV